MTYKARLNNFSLNYSLLELDIKNDNNVLDSILKIEKKEQLENDLKALKSLVSITFNNLVTSENIMFASSNVLIEFCFKHINDYI